MNELKKWKVLTIIFVAIAIISASFAGYYAQKASEIGERNEGLMKVGVRKMGCEFLKIAPPTVFESYPYPYPITTETMRGWKHQDLTEENTDAFLDQLYCWCTSISGDLHDLSGLRRYCSNSELEALAQLSGLTGFSSRLRRNGLTERCEAISAMTNKTWRKEALEELISTTKDDFRKIGRLLQDGELSMAAEIAASGEARQYLDQPAYPIEVAVGEYKIGENIIWIKNNWDRTIELPAPPYVILKKDVGSDYDGHRITWKKIYEPAITQAVHLKPGEKKEWIWNQKDANDTQVGAGYCKAVFSVDGWVEGKYSDSLIIRKRIR